MATYEAPEEQKKPVYELPTEKGGAQYTLPDSPPAAGQPQPSPETPAAPSIHYDPPPDERTPTDEATLLRGVPDAAAAISTGMFYGTIGVMAHGADTIMQTIGGNPQGAYQHGKDLANKIIEWGAWKPRTEGGQKIATAVNKPFEIAVDLMRKSGKKLGIPEWAVDAAIDGFWAGTAGVGIGKGFYRPQAPGTPTPWVKGELAPPRPKPTGGEAEILKGFETPEAKDFETLLKEGKVPDLGIDTTIKADAGLVFKTFEDWERHMKENAPRGEGHLDRETGEVLTGPKVETPEIAEIVPPTALEPLSIDPEIPAGSPYTPERKSLFKRLFSHKTPDAPGLNEAGLGDPSNHHAYARERAYYWVRWKFSQVFPDIYKDPDKLNQFADLMNKNRILGGYDRFMRRWEQAIDEGRHADAQAWRRKADEVAGAHDLIEYDREVKEAWEGRQGKQKLNPEWKKWEAKRKEATAEPKDYSLPPEEIARVRDVIRSQGAERWKHTKPDEYGTGSFVEVQDDGEWGRRYYYNERFFKGMVFPSRQAVMDAFLSRKRIKNKIEVVIPEEPPKYLKEENTEVFRNLKTYIDNWREHIEKPLTEMYNENRGVDPNHFVDTDGRYWKAHINLLHYGEEGAWMREHRPDPPGYIKKATDWVKDQLGIDEAKPATKSSLFSAKTGGAIKINDKVKSPDRGNIGKVLTIDQRTGMAKVEFTNPKTKATMVIDYPVSELQSISGPGKASEVGTAAHALYRNPDVQPDRWSSEATFTGTYSTDLHEIVASVFGSRWNEITKLRLYNSIIEKGVGVLMEPRQRRPTTLNGLPVHKKPLEFTLPKLDENGKRVLETRKMWVQDRVYSELIRVLDTADKVPRDPLGNVLTGIQIAGLTDATVHLKNEISILAKSTGREKQWADLTAKLPILGQGQAAAELIQMCREIIADSPEIRAEMDRAASVGTFRSRYHSTGPMKWGHEIISQADAAGRILLNRWFDKQVAEGKFVNTEMNRRRFMNQMGMYNRRLMGPIQQWLRDRGWSAFVVAGRNFNANLGKMLAGAPGAETTGLAANVELRAKVISGLVAATTVPFLINLETTGSLTGRPGTPFGACDLGLPLNPDGSWDVIDLYNLTGYRRAFRVTGLGAVVEGVRNTHDINQIVGQITRDVFTSRLSPWVGPAGKFAYEATTGLNVGTGKQQAYKIPEGGGKQTLENIRASAEALSPWIYTGLGGKAKDIPKTDWGNWIREQAGTWLGDLFDSVVKQPAQAFGKGKAFESKTGAEQLAYSYYRSKFGSGVTEEQEAKFKFNQQMKVLLKEDEELGSSTLEDFADEGKITRQTKKRLEKIASRARILTWVEGMELPQAIDVFDSLKKEGDNQKIIEVADAIGKKFRHSRRSIPEEQREKYYDIVQGILDYADQLEGY